MGCCASKQQPPPLPPPSPPLKDPIGNGDLNGSDGEEIDKPTFNYIVSELGLQTAGMSEPDLKELEEYINSLKERQTSTPSFNLCPHHEELLRGKPQPVQKPAKAKAASRSQMKSELLRKPSLFRKRWDTDWTANRRIQSFLGKLDIDTARMEPSAHETKDMLFALYSYTRPEIYRAFNRDHRELRPEHWAALSSTMRCAVESARSPNAGDILYRGDDRESYTLRKGQLDRTNQFTSTSLNRKIALKFSKNKWMFEYTGVPADHCASVAHASKFPHENEVLIAPIHFMIRMISPNHAKKSLLMIMISVNLE